MQIFRRPPTDPNPGSCPWASRQEFRMKFNREQSRLFFCAQPKIGDWGELRRLGSFCQANLNWWNRARRWVALLLCSNPHIRAIVQGSVDGPRRGSLGSAILLSDRHTFESCSWHDGPGTPGMPGQVPGPAASGTLNKLLLLRAFVPQCPSASVPSHSPFWYPGAAGYTANSRTGGEPI